MKIYEIGTGYTPIPAQMGAATEIVVEELVKAFLHDKKECILVDIAARDRLYHDFQIEEVKVPNVFSTTDIQLGIIHKIKRVVYSIALAHKLKYILKKSDQDVVLHFHNQYNLFFFLKLVNEEIRKRATIVYTVHSYIWPTEWNEIEGIVRKRYFQEVFCVQNADVVFVLNEKTGRNFVEHLAVNPEKIHKILNGVNTDIYSPISIAEKRKIREELGCVDKKVILQVGSVCDRKNQLGFLKSFAGYLKANPNVVYMYAGGVIDQEYQKEIENFAEHNCLSKQIRYVGEVCPGKELNKYYNIADLTVFPSKIEAFGLVIIESISAGTPVLLFSKPLFDLQNGYAVSDGRDLEQMVEELLALDASTGRIEVEEKYSWNRIARDYWEIFQK